jgi:hypothetical protein
MEYKIIVKIKAAEILAAFFLKKHRCQHDCEEIKLNYNENKLL